MAPTIEDCCAFALIAPCLGAPQLPLVGYGRDAAGAAARSSKPKLALLGAHDQFCSVPRFEAWAATMRLPAEHHVVLGREIEMPCCGGAHTRVRRAMTHHFNLFEYLPEHVGAWAESTFGLPIEKLGTSDGSVVSVA